MQVILFKTLGVRPISPRSTFPLRVGNWLRGGVTIARRWVAAASPRNPMGSRSHPVSANTAGSPHLNGKVERVQRTVLEEFSDAADSKAADIGEQLAQWISYYNWHRPHESLHGRSPIDRLCQLASQTPLWGEVGEACDPKKERIRVRDHAVDIALQVLR